MDIVKERGVYYEKLKALYPVLLEEIGELGEALEVYETMRDLTVSEAYLVNLYDEIQDVSIVLLSMFSTVRLKLKGHIKGDII